MRERERERERNGCHGGRSWDERRIELSGR